MARKYPLHPGHPERICWGCEQLCPANDMRCGNGTERAQHPFELWGEDWMSLGLDAGIETGRVADGPTPSAAGPAGCGTRPSGR